MEEANPGEPAVAPSTAALAGDNEAGAAAVPSPEEGEPVAETGAAAGGGGGDSEHEAAAAEWKRKHGDAANAVGGTTTTYGAVTVRALLSSPASFPNTRRYC